MHFDALTLACITDELHRALAGGRVQQILMVDSHSIGMEVYVHRQRRHLLLSASNTASRAYLSSQKLRRGVDAQPPLLLLLRKWVRGSLLKTITQPDPIERVLRIEFEHPVHGESTLVLEPLGRTANLLLLKPDGRILECIHRVRGGKSPRTLMPGKPYAPPPPMDKLPPLDDGRDDYYARLAGVTQADGKLWRALVGGVAGVSPTQARELTWRAAGSVDAAASAVDVLALVEALQSLWMSVTSGEWRPGLVIEGDEIVGFAPYELHYRGRFEPVESMSAALERFYAGGRGADTEAAVKSGVEFTTPGDAYAALRGAVANQIKQARKKVQRRLTALAADEPKAGEPERLRRDADWLLALASQIEARQRELTVDLGEETLHIALDARKTPIEQAQRMYKRAAKLERAAKIIPRRRAELEADLAFLEQLALDLSMAENQPEIETVQRELQRMGLAPIQRRQPRRSGQQATGPRRFKSAQGFEILVGRNARQNEAVTFRMAHAEDLWLHARNAPGSHVVVRRRGAQPDEATILAAAQLAAYYSRLRGERSAPVIVVPKRFVSRAAGGRTGQVRVRNEEVITVAAELPDGVVLQKPGG